MDIVRITDGNYETYENLLLQRDQLEKEAEEYRRRYMQLFGDLITDVFTKKIECIALKKSIAYCLKVKNWGNMPDRKELQQYLDMHMAAYNEELESLISERDASRGGSPVSVLDYAKIKEIYRRIAKMLHPDVSPLTGKYPELMELFQKAVTAYHCNDLKSLQETEFMINAVLDGFGEETFDMMIEDIDEKIEDIEEEIQQILTSVPYIYGDLVSDPEAVDSKKAELENELNTYVKYAEELEKNLREVLGQEG